MKPNKTGQVWGAQRYAQEAGFVVDMGSDLLSWLQPRAGEQILDVGCGEGSLTLQLVAAGADVLAIDSNAEQIELAQQRGLNAQVMDASQLQFTEAFDAVFSNAAFHWIADLQGLVNGLWQALRPGGRLVVEFGGAGNIAAILNALQKVFARHGLNAMQYQPWYFCMPEQWRTALDAAGFVDSEIQHYARLTPIGQSIRNWLELMAGDYLNPLPRLHSLPLREPLLNELVDELRPSLYDSEKGWWVDYVRLRIKAIKPA